MTQTPLIGRFAPSPTGPMHFGSLVAAVGSYCLARQAGGQWLMRMEDLDTPRVVPGAADEILRTIERLGMPWDGEVLWQSERTEIYQAALDRLRDNGLVFDCACSRKEILASAPHPGEEGPVYPGTCRQGLPPGRRSRALRVRVSGEQVCFTDGVFGPLEQVLSSAVGDFVLRRADGLFAYQLAVVVDDAESGINQVVRGADLLSSTPRQIFLHACFGNPVPDYIHLPLAVSSDGEKISKRHGVVNLASTDDDPLWLCRALRFLGQDVPGELIDLPAHQIMEWAVKTFDRTRIPVAPQGIPVPENGQKPHKSLL